MAGKALDGTATATVDAAGSLAFPSIALTIAGNRITGALERSAAGLLAGSLAVDAPDLKPLAALALVEASGRGTARMQFAPDGTQQNISIAFNGDGVTYGALTAQSVTGEARIEDATGTPRVTGQSVLSDARAGSLRLDRASLTASAADGATRFDADLAGPDLALKGGGRLVTSEGGQAVVIETLTGTAYRLPVNLAQPVTVALGGAEQGRVDADLALGGGHVRVKGTASPTLDLSVAIDAVSATALSAVAPALGAEGAISANATISGAPSSPKIEWQGTWSGLRVTATRNAGLPGLAFSGRGVATLSESSLDATLSGAGLSLAISGSVPFSGPGLRVHGARHRAAFIARAGIGPGTAARGGGQRRCHRQRGRDGAAVLRNGGPFGRDVCRSRNRVRRYRRIGADCL